MSSTPKTTPKQRLSQQRKPWYQILEANPTHGGSLHSILGSTSKRATSNHLLSRHTLPRLLSLASSSTPVSITSSSSSSATLSPGRPITPPFRPYCRACYLASHPRLGIERSRTRHWKSPILFFLIFLIFESCGAKFGLSLWLSGISRTLRRSSNSPYGYPNPRD